MKSAEEWATRLCEEVHTNGLRVHAEKLVKQIQLDAMREGMRRAADKIWECHNNGWISIEAVRREVLTAAEQLTIESL